MSNSPFDLQTYTRKLEGEFSSSSEVTWSFIPGTPSIYDHPEQSEELKVLNCHGRLSLTCKLGQSPS